MTGKEFSRLMRQHKVTIAQLAERMDVPQAAVWRARIHGLTIPGQLDYTEAVRGYVTAAEALALAEWRQAH